LDVTARVSAVVPTLGRSPLLVPCLEALLREGGPDLEIVIVDQAPEPTPLPSRLTGCIVRVVRPGRNLGFAGGANAGIAAASGELVALVNDDVLVEPGWLGALTDALAADPGAAAVQGVNLLLDDPGRADGCGIAWNRWWQAVQVGHGLPAPAAGEPPREVFGVSATAALFRRDALAAVASVDGGVFEPRLGSYYEDVDLAGRLRAAGWRALLAPVARARHAGSVTGRTLGSGRWLLIHGNRYLVAARCLGGSFWTRLPRMAARDLLDLGRAALAGDGARVAGIAGGWGRAVRHLSAFARRGAPAVPLRDVERFR
jgi:GT2 family glycosyltransferase